MYWFLFSPFPTFSAVRSTTPYDHITSVQNSDGTIFFLLNTKQTSTYFFKEINDTIGDENGFISRAACHKFLEPRYSPFLCAPVTTLYLYALYIRIISRNHITSKGGIKQIPFNTSENRAQYNKPT